MTKSIERRASLAFIRRCRPSCLVAGFLALGIGWVIGHRLAAPGGAALDGVKRIVRLNASGDRPVGTEDIEANFEATVSKWNRLVISNGGRLPADPYHALLDLDALSDVRDASVLRTIEFARPLPPRLSPRLAENPHLPVFWWNPWAAPGEEWVCYADGSWTRRTECVDQSIWRDTLRGSGFPVDQWTTWKARAAWMAKAESGTKESRE